ncbi:MAG TPA: ZIP family metal transporter [Symbiobacteriaceae bacterium]|nr:ZIP family metal transporter [Symbiobacteriaceae bacterium]
MILRTLTESPWLWGLTLSVLAGLATTLGAFPVLWSGPPSDRLHDGMLGGAAGVMLAATAFSLMLPAIEAAGGGLGGVFIAVLGLVLGAAAIDLTDRLAPHEHFLRGPEGGALDRRLARIWLFVIAIAIHNFPEGVAVGVAAGSGDTAGGLTVALAITLQNVPEGLAVAAALTGEGYRAGYAVAITGLTGLVEVAGGVLGLGAVLLVRPLLPWALAFAGGAMLFVVSDEVIPESHQRGNQRFATFCLVGGFALMMCLDVALS